MKVNASKCGIMHFRRARKMKSKRMFRLCDENIDLVGSYKYLGVYIQENMKYDNMVDILSNSSSRALGALLSKYKIAGDMGYGTYQTLYNNCVIPVMDYGCEIWGYDDFNKNNMVQNRAMRYYLNVNRYCPIAGLYSDLGWIHSRYRHWLKMLLFWNRLVRLNDDRLTKHVLKFDLHCKGDSWSSIIGKIVRNLGLEVDLESVRQINILEINEAITKYNREWVINQCRSSDKLRTYRLFKDDNVEEKYLKMFLPRYQRSHFSQFRFGIFPIRIETGRYKREKIEERLCCLCSRGEIEDEPHVLIVCDKYKIERDVLYNKVTNIMPMFGSMDNMERFNVLMKDFPRQVSNFLYKISEKRRNLKYI
jgi:hypothetical protein